MGWNGCVYVLVNHTLLLRLCLICRPSSDDPLCPLCIHRVKPNMSSSCVCRTQRLCATENRVSLSRGFSRVPTRGTFPARKLCGCGLERGSAQDPPLRTLSSGSESPPADSAGLFDSADSETRPMLETGH